MEGLPPGCAVRAVAREHLLPVDLAGKGWRLRVETWTGSVGELAFDHHVLAALCAWGAARLGSWPCPSLRVRQAEEGRETGAEVPGPAGWWQ